MREIAMAASLVIGACATVAGDDEPAATESGAGSTTAAPSTDSTRGDDDGDDDTGGESSPPGESSGGDDTTGDAPPSAFVPAFVDRTFRCKLVSDTALEDPTANELQTRFNLTGTDLGISVVTGDTLHVLFGDSVGYRVIWPFGEDPDAVGRIDHAAVLADPTVLCHDLELYVTPDVPSVAASTDPAIERDFAGVYMTPPAGEPIAAYIADPAGPFANMPGTFEVPAGALAIDPALYIFYAGRVSFDPYTRMMLGYLARWDTPGEGLPSLQIVRPIDALDEPTLGGHFIQIAPLLDDDRVYMFGTGDYRRSPVYLARVDRQALETGAGTQIWNAATATWLDAETASLRERQSVGPLFETEGVGELSVVHVPAIDAIVVMYQRELHDATGAIVDNRIVARVASTPTGPWSDAVTIIDMADPAFTSVHCCGATCPGDAILHCDVAGLYGAYMIPAIGVTPRPEGDVILDIPFLASTWNPYNVVLFSTRIALTPVA